MKGGEYYGAKAEFNIWNVHVEPKEFSASKISLLSSNDPDASSIQAGWLVCIPSHFSFASYTESSFIIQTQIQKYVEMDLMFIKL